MRRLVLGGAAALIVAAPAAHADPRPTGYSGTTCDHAGIASEPHHRKVDYLWQRYVGCATAQHVGRLWVHSCAHVFSGCNLDDHGKYWYCTAHEMAHSKGEYLATCNSGSFDQIKIGWHR